MSNCLSSMTQVSCCSCEYPDFKNVFSFSIMILKVSFGLVFPVAYCFLSFFSFLFLLLALMVTTLHLSEI